MDSLDLLEMRLRYVAVYEASRSDFIKRVYHQGLGIIVDDLTFVTSGSVSERHGMPSIVSSAMPIHVIQDIAIIQGLPAIHDDV